MNRLGLRFLRSVALGILPAALLACSGSHVSTSRTSVAPSLVLEVGEVFPDLRLPALDDGHAVSLARFRGQKVILHVFASW